MDIPSKIRFCNFQVVIRPGSALTLLPPVQVVIDKSQSANQDAACLTEMVLLLQAKFIGITVEIIDIDLPRFILAGQRVNLIFHVSQADKLHTASCSKHGRTYPV